MNRLDVQARWPDCHASDIIDEVGRRCGALFFVMLSIDQPLTFDLALAKEQSSDNPVFYVQYGPRASHRSCARRSNVMRRCSTMRSAGSSSNA